MVKPTMKSGKLTAVNSHHNKSRPKSKRKKSRHKTFNAEIKEDSDSSSLESDTEKKINEEIVILFKEAVRKMPSSK